MTGANPEESVEVARSATDILVRAEGPARRSLNVRRLWPYLYATPAVVVLGLVFIYPLVGVVRDSFYSGTASHLTYDGVSNYHFVVTDPTFTESLFNNLRLLISVPVMTLIALAIALLLNEVVRGWKTYRFILFMPYILPAVGVGLGFSYLLEQGGVLNAILTDLRVHMLAMDWLGSERLSIYSLGGVIIWQQLGFGVVLFTAGLLSLPQEVTEAAIMDGANWWQRQLRVVIPQLRRIIELFVILEAITVLSWVFTYVYVITHGGPGISSYTMTYFIWQNGFELGNVGIGASAAVILLIMAGALIAIYVTIRARRGEL